MIQQTVDIPANRKLYLELPETVPSGKTKVILEFKSPVQTDTYPEPLSGLEKLLKEAEEKRLYFQAHPEEIRALRGCLPGTAFGGMDGVTFQRKTRAEWEDPPVKRDLSAAKG
ncbi:hypothetical protein AGMMS4952_02300 [Spirochaetia bacterium]|nr:hypothetical protein AGMMS4952_02300 [Spirochaetia bacterium]